MSSKVVHTNRNSATGVVGVMRRAEDRKRRQQVSSTSAQTYIAEHRISEMLDMLVGRVLHERPAEPLRLVEQLLREVGPNGQQRDRSHPPAVLIPPMAVIADGALAQPAKPRTSVSQASDSFNHDDITDHLES
eukprot:GILI01018449.1.p1 GENE.GILI01018449.1~~GILI01018449.1.p1  ORF type:complete len:133 (+),score=12.61 GILI01018449.1:63-461(+)